MPLYEPQCNFLKQVFIGDSLGKYFFNYGVHEGGYLGFRL